MWSSPRTYKFYWKTSTAKHGLWPAWPRWALAAPQYCGGGLEDRARARRYLGSGLGQALRKLWENSSLILLGKTIPHTDKHAQLRGSKVWESKKPYSLIHASGKHQQTFGYNDVLRTPGISLCSFFPPPHPRPQIYSSLAKGNVMTLILFNVVNEHLKNIILLNSSSSYFKPFYGY